MRLADTSDEEATEGLTRFRREAQAAGRLSHPNIVSIYDYGETDENAYIVMEFIEGNSLKALLDTKQRLPIGERVRIAEELLAGLQFSHDRGVIHRDIKPANVMVATNGQTKIADFGIARIQYSNMTQIGAMIGTPAYMSPEQFMGQAVDARTDIYSSGVLLYRMLSGRRPFEGTPGEIMQKVVNAAPPHPPDLPAGTPPGFDAVVARAMARHPADRFASAAEFARALRGAFESARGKVPTIRRGEEVDATIPAVATRAARGTEPALPSRASRGSAPTSQRRRSAIAALVGATAVILIAAGVGTWFAAAVVSLDVV